MLRNFILVAFRSMARQLSYSVINVVGLAIGIACSLVIFLFVYGEWSYDRNYTNSERIYKVGISFFNIGNFANGPERLLNVLPDQFDGIEAATRIRRQGDVIVEVDGKQSREKSVYYTDSSYFKVFHNDFVSGQGIKAPSDIVLTETAATKYFGSPDAVGKPMLLGPDKKEFFVVGIVKPIEFNATVKADMFVAIDEFLKNDPNWSSASLFSFILLKPNFGEADVQAALDRVIEHNVFPEVGKAMGFATLEDFRKGANSIRFLLHPLRDVYLKSKLRGELTAGGSETNMYSFSAISVFILLLAGVNFINLTTARASRRAKEVAIRKTMGTSRRRLILQFLSESLMISTVAMVLSLFLAEVFLLAFTFVTDAPLLTTIWKNTDIVLLFAGFSVVVGLCSGLYPAFYLTAFNPIKVLKGNMSADGGSSFRNALVVFQFAVSMILIVCAFVVQQQLHFIQTKELGFDQNNILTIDHAYLFSDEAAHTYKNELDRMSGVIKSTHHMGEPGSRRFVAFYTYKTKGMEEPLTINTYPGDANLLNVLGIRLIAGRGFDENLASDSAATILNESAVNALGLNTDEAIGAVINDTDRIIGVVSDFHWESLHNSIAPVAFRLTKKSGEISFKLEPGHVKDFLAAAEKKWKEMLPNDTFTYHFVDSNFEDLLKKDAVFGKAINFFTLLAIFISCLGLYGLSAFTAEQRTKEIGIRKVLGATSAQIVLMLNRKFTILVSIAIIVSVPVAVWLMSQWLDGFAYKITLGAGVFIFSILMALFTAWITVSLHSVRASWVNPSEALKYE